MKVESSFAAAVVVGVTTTSSSFNLLAVIAAVANAPVATILRIRRTLLLNEVKSQNKILNSSPPRNHRRMQEIPLDYLLVSYITGKKRG
jgi:hypothetical protein